MGGGTIMLYDATNLNDVPIQIKEHRQQTLAEDSAVLFFFCFFSKGQRETRAVLEPRTNNKSTITNKNMFVYR